MCLHPCSTNVFKLLPGAVFVDNSNSHNDDDDTDNKRQYQHRVDWLCGKSRRKMNRNVGVLSLCWVPLVYDGLRVFFCKKKKFRKILGYQWLNKTLTPLTLKVTYFEVGTSKFIYKSTHLYSTFTQTNSHCQFFSCKNIWIWSSFKSLFHFIQLICSEGSSEKKSLISGGSRISQRRGR